MKNTDFDLFIYILLCMGIIGGIIIGAVKCVNEHDEKLWNNGYCECGGHFEYEQAVGHQYSTTYIYTCDSCGKHIEIYGEER